MPTSSPPNDDDVAESLRLRRISDECRIALFHLTEAERAADTHDLFFEDIHKAMSVVAGVIDDALDRFPNNDAPHDKG